MSRALVIGHTGQDGQILCEQLAERGFSLAGVSRTRGFSSDGQWSRPVDVTNLAQVNAVVETFRPTRVYYLAAHHHSSQEAAIHHVDTAARSWDVHVHGFGHVLEAVRASAPDARIFYASSSRVFGSAAGPMQNESTPLRPECIYGLTKAAGMFVADFARRVHGQFVACGILFNHESALRASQFVSQRVIQGLAAIRRGDAKILELGNLDARVDWGSAPDYTRAMQCILDAGEPTEYVIASGETHSVREFVEVAADRLGLRWRDCVVETEGLVQRAPQALCGDASRLRSTTGWSPSLDFKGLVRSLVDTAMAQGVPRP